MSKRQRNRELEAVRWARRYQQTVVEFEMLLSTELWHDVVDFTLTSIEQWPKTWLVLMRRHRNPWQAQAWWRV